MKDHTSTYFTGKQSNEFRTVYSNHTGLQFNGFEVMIKFGILEDLGNVNAGHTDQVAVIMNAANMKALSMTLNAIIKHHEELSGATIAVSPQVQKNIEASLAAVSKQQK